MNREGAQKKIIIALALVGAMILILFRAAAVDAVYPVEKAYRTFLRTVWTRLKGAWQGAGAAAENVRLKRELDALAFVRSDMEKLEAENDRLRRTLGYVQRSGAAWVPACVLSRGGAAVARQMIRIDKGADAGVAVGAVVAVPEGLVGRVTAVSRRTSEVTLITDASVQVSCEIENVDIENRVRAILTGGSEERLALKYLSRLKTSLPPRARVITSGLGDVFPRGIEVGTYAGEDGVTPSVDFSALEDVFVRRVK